MIAPICSHSEVRTNGKDRNGNTRYRCKLCGKTWVDAQPVKPLGPMRIPVDSAKMVLRLLTEGMSIRGTERTTRIYRNTICKLIVLFGDKCRAFLDARMRNLTLTHLQFDEQWTFVQKKQSRLTIDERAECCDKGDVYLWTCIDQRTKLMPSFLIGKRSADNARRFMIDVAGRLVFPNPTPATPMPTGKVGTCRSCNCRRTVSQPTRKRSTLHSAPTSVSARSRRNTATRA